jgi:hypothetical protein
VWSPIAKFKHLPAAVNRYASLSKSNHVNVQPRQHHDGDDLKAIEGKLK